MKKTTSWDYAPENYSKEKASALVTKQNRLSLKFLMLLLLFVGVSVSEGWGQATLVNYTFDGSGTTGATNVISLSGVNPTFTVSGATLQYFNGNPSTGKAAAMAAISNGTRYFDLTLTTTGYTDLSITFDGYASNTGTTWTLNGDATGGTSMSTTGISLSLNKDSWTSKSSALLGSSYGDKSLIRLRFTVGNANTVRIDNIIITGKPLTPTTTSISPTSAVAGSSGFTLTVNGTNFISGLSTITWGGVNKTTTFVSSNQLTASISAADIASAGTVAVGVTTTGATSSSNTQTFTINTASNPLFGITGTTNHGSSCLNTASTTQTYTITNTGTAATNVVVSSSDPQFVVSNLLSTSIAGAGGTATYDVTFTPTSTGAKSSTITLFYDTDISAATSTVTGTGINTAPTVTTSVATGVGLYSATIPGTISNTGCTSITAYGIEYSTTSNFANGTGTQIAGSNLSGSNYSVDLSGLNLGTTYYYKTYATNSGGTSYSAQSSFTTLMPTITAGTVTAFGSQTVNTTSNEKSYTVSGANLISDVTITPPAGFEISLTSGSGFVANPSTIVISPTSGTLASTTIYVRFKPTTVSSYSSLNIAHTATSASTKNVVVSGMGTAVTNPASFSATAISTNQINLTSTANANSDNIVVVYAASSSFSTPTNGVASGDVGDAFAGGTILYKGSAASLVNHTGLNPTQTVYYKAFSYDALYFYSSGSTANATSKTPTITVGSITSFGNVTVNTTSTEKNYTISGVDLLSDVTIAPPAGFEISLTSGSGFVANPSTIVLSPTSGTLASTTIYVRFKPTTVSSYSSLNIAHTATSASTKSVAVSGTGIAPTNPTLVSATTSSYQQINLEFTPNGSNNVIVAYNTSNTFGTPSGNYSVSDVMTGGGTVIYKGTGSSYNHTGLLANTAYYYKVWTVDALNFYSTGVNINATTSDLSAATANTATSISSTGFVANWGAVVGASEYKLDVYSQTSGTNATDLFISEYIEGNSNNKYIEIFNGTGASIDLSNYKLRLYNNGGSSPDNDVMLSGTLQNNSTIVYKNSNASLTLPNGVNATNSTACAFNGDDAIALFKISSNSNVDIFGRIGNDPGTAWTSASNSTLDKTLVRKSSVLGGIATNPSGTGSTAFTTLESEWTQFDIDNVSNLGSHAFVGGTILSFSIQNLSVATTYQEVTGLTPNSTYYYRVRAVGANSTSANSNVVSVLTLPAAPVAEAASTVNALNFVANWTLPATGADSYTLDVATDEDFNNKLEAYNNLTVTGTSQAISGLSRNTTYYYRVKSVNASGASVSNVISVSTGNAIIVTGSNESAGSLADCADCDLVVNQGSHLTVNANKSFNSVTIKPGAKLTLNNGQTFAPGTFVLESNASATATFVDKRTHANKTDITATVQQHLPAASTRTWWYLASPVTGAASSVFGSNKVGDYSEANRSYSSPFAAPTTLTAGKGYVVKMTAASAANYVFENKTLNTGNISVPLTRTVTGTADNAKRGFNLVGNPYPSYLNWELAYAVSTNIRSTIWYRTLDGTSMEFHTYNAELGVGSPTTASEYIPPMQAFWVKVDTDPVSPATVSNGTLNFTNDMRSHDESVDGNPLKTPAADRNLVRLSISNGTLSDETVIATHPSASDSYDRFDSEKMANGDTNRPEIFSLAGNQELVINGISPLTDSKQIALGVRPGVAGNYTINLTEWRNTGNMEAVLRDNQLGEELILTESNNYSFDTDGSTSTSRFSLLFRAKGSNTGFDRISSDLMIYSTQNTIRVESASLEGNTISIFNALGQPVFNGKAQSNRLEINGLTPAVYLVKVNNQTKMVIVK